MNFCFLFILSTRQKKIKAFVLFLAGMLKILRRRGRQCTHNLHKKVRILLEIRSQFAVK